MHQEHKCFIPKLPANKLASATLGNNSSEPQFKKQNSATANNSATKNARIIGKGKKGDEKEEENDDNDEELDILELEEILSDEDF